MDTALAKPGIFDRGKLEFPELEIGDEVIFEEKFFEPNLENMVPDESGQEAVEERFSALTLDLRDHFEFSPVGHQGSTKSCSAFALASLIEFYLRNGFNKTSTLAIGWMHACVGGEPLSEAVSFERLAFELKSRHIPIVSRQHPWNSTECDRDGVIRVPNLRAKSAYGYKFVKRLLRSGRPVVTSLIVNEDFESWDSEKPYNYNSQNDPYEHAVLVIGYDKKHWICRNSFGESWGGEEGYFRVKFGNCFLCTGKIRVFTFSQTITEHLV